MTTRVLVAGGAGFIGSNFVRHVLREHPDWEVVNLDKLTYAGNLQNLKDVQSNPRHHFVKGDIGDRELLAKLLEQRFHALVNFAAESHVDRSILDPSPFIETNVKGTQVLLEGARQHGVGLFIQVSTDEVYGSLGDAGQFSEQSLLSPNSPYAASKAAADLLCQAYFRTYGLPPVVITRCSNNYGPFQFPEKFVPLVITNAFEDEHIPVYGDGLNVRDWIHVKDHCLALDMILQQGRPGQIYNIGGGNEETNLELVHRVLDIMGKPRSLVTFVTDRPGHDRRYAVNAGKIRRELGFAPGISFAEGLKSTVDWYIEHEPWWRDIKSGEYAEYYDRMYGKNKEL